MNTFLVVIIRTGVGKKISVKYIFKTGLFGGGGGGGHNDKILMDRQGLFSPP